MSIRMSGAIRRETSDIPFIKQMHKGAAQSCTQQARVSTCVAVHSRERFE